MPRKDVQGPGSTLPASYSLTWRLVKPFLGLILRHRAKQGKEDPARLLERFGLYQTSLPKGAIWVHAVSVGEAVAGLSLIEALAAQLPSQTFIITTNTVTAAKLVNDWTTGANLTHLYQPLDHPAYVDRFLDASAPMAAIFMESDFWPNLIHKTAERDIPVIFASSQISDAAAARWRRRPAIAAAVFGTAELVLAVNDKQAGRLCDLGARSDIVHRVGSLKLTSGGMKTDPSLMAMLKQAAGDRRIFLAASTHEGEDLSVIRAAQALGNEWFTLLAPRHPKRGDTIAALCQDQMPGAKAPTRRALGQTPATEEVIHIVDTLGEMGSLFAIADVVFLGGSLLPIGGHNPLEPAQFGLPVICGPHLAKNQAEFDAIREIGGVTDIANGDELADAVKAGILTDKEKQISESAMKSYAERAGKRPAIAADYILKLLHDRTPSQ
ncbi:MAG: glycosyltransferase N-terminal domain-containing protein [Alphaproteobacteria bacterium]